jgi:hypothetical protein
MGSLDVGESASPIGPKTKVHAVRQLALRLGEDGQDIDGNQQH